ncbi:hypothetical protein [Paraburkholderia aromaticivorans]|uniref:hypothetical protein n=1 Tax=Paraburkholderia aromaticivorans TaxID=2026199 RepID=UPI001455E700|nr:hypothetical protein [Paraburkholderia aromaticivorans]
MDRLIAPNSVIAAQADAAPATGTPQFATDGNPATNTPATQWPAYQYNALQEELIAILVAAGVTPDRTQNNQINAALRKMYTPVIGFARNVSAFLGTTGPTVTFNADEIVVKAALGGQSYMLSPFSKAVSLGGTGIGGVVGTAPAANGFAAVYAAYGLVAGAGIFVTDATAAKASEVAGVTLPSGYTASALIGIVPMGTTTANFAPFLLMDRKVDWGGGNLLTSSTFVGGPTARPSTAFIPLNARFISGFNQVGSTTASAVSQVITPTSIAGAGGQYNTVNIQSGASQAIPFRVAVVTPQTIYQQSSNSAGTPGFTISTNSFEF